MSSEHSCCHHKGTTHAAPPSIQSNKEWFCPMCPGAESDKPGSCFKCGMALERNPTFKSTPLYTCPMHPEIQAKESGECPICGMALEPVLGTSSDDTPNAELMDMQRRFWIACILTLPVVVLAMGEHLFGHWIAPSTSAWVQFLLSTPVVLWAGLPFFIRGVRSLITRHFNMFTLIALGTSAAYLFSLVVLLFPQIIPQLAHHGASLPIYFEAAAAIITLVLLGQVLELRARAGTGKAIRALLDLTPKTAHRLKDVQEEDVPLSQVMHGDILRVKPGENVPVDGKVIQGTSTIDESMLTGESLPVKKDADSAVVAGTLNIRGSFLMKAERVGSETLLSQIVEMVATAQRSRAPIQRLADQVASWFVPAVVLIAIATFITWIYFGPEPAFIYALINAVSVLIIACPCALGLATPMSIMVGVGRGASLGVLIKDAEALETLGRINTLVVDKTGTLTEGRPTITDIHPIGEHSQEQILSLAAALEAQSEHPLASAVVSAAKEKSILLPHVDDFESLTGNGIQGKIQGQFVVVGKANLLTQSVPEVAMQKAAELQKEGKTVIWVGVNGSAIGVLALIDPIKPSAKEAIQTIHKMGIRICMLTGDNFHTAKQIGTMLGIDEIVAEMSPAQKQEHLIAWKNKGAKVAMAGDGINDAPALAVADVGIAMGTGTDVAMQTAGITLLKGDLRGIVHAILLSRATMRNIRQNLAFAFLYNSLGVPIAAGVLYPFFGLLLSPIIASAAMAFSSVSVIGNALRLRKAI